MSLPVLHVKMHEKERFGCPIARVAGMDYIALWRVCEALRLSEKDTLRLLAHPDRAESLFAGGRA